MQEHTDASVSPADVVAFVGLAVLGVVLNRVTGGWPFGGAVALLLGGLATFPFIRHRMTMTFRKWALLWIAAAIVTALFEV